MYKYSLPFIIILFLCFAGCASQSGLSGVETLVVKSPEDDCFNFSRLSPDDLRQADSLLASAFNQEGLHTLVSGLKPMSDVAAYNWIVEETDTLENGEILTKNRSEEFKDDYERLERISDVFSCGPLASAAFPFKNLYKGERYVQFRIYRKDTVDRMLEQNPEFWSRWAFVKGSNPAIIISVMEYEERMVRFRGYGHLYGYPDHAVDFFVESAKHEEETGEFVERDFINLPVVSEDSGRFVYAVEKGDKLTPADEQIRDKAQQNVDLYHQKIEAYRDEEGNIDYPSFLRDLYLEKGWVE